MPVYKKGTKWRVRIWHKGERQDFILDGTKEEAVQFEAQKRVEFMATSPAGGRRTAPSFSDFSSKEYKAHGKRHLKSRTWSNRTYTIATLTDHFRSTKLTEIDTVLIEAYKNKRIDAKIKASTINDELKVLRTILAYARDLGIPTATPKIKDLPTRGVKRKVTHWTRPQVDQLLKAMRADSPELEPLVVFLLNTGCRRGEALALEWKHVDLKRGLIRIEPSEEWQPKDGEAREIPISDALHAVLSRGSKSKRWVFPTRKGTRYKFWPQRAFDRARIAAKLQGGPHTTRHTFASHFLFQRPDLFLLGRILGHSHQHMTELYSHLLPDHLALARNVVNFGPVAEKEERAAA